MRDFVLLISLYFLDVELDVLWPEPDVFLVDTVGQVEIDWEDLIDVVHVAHAVPQAPGRMTARVSLLRRRGQG